MKFDFDLLIICLSVGYCLPFVDWEFLILACHRCSYKSFVVYLITNGCRLLISEMKQQLITEYSSLRHSSTISCVKTNHINHLVYYYITFRWVPGMSIVGGSCSFFMLESLVGNCFLDPMMRISIIGNFIKNRIGLFCLVFCAYSYLDFNDHSITTSHYNVVINWLVCYYLRGLFCFI